MVYPGIGRLVIVRAHPALNGGGTEAPALITRVHDDLADDGVPLVNVRVLLDGGDATPAKTRVPLYPTQAMADAAVPTRTNTHVAWWPPT